MKRRIVTAFAALLITVSLLFESAPVPARAEDGEERAFPPYYDLRGAEGNCYVTPVRSRAPFSACRSFAAAAALESSILSAGLAGADGDPADPETLDISEKQIAWFSAMPLRDSGDPQNGEGQYFAGLTSEKGLTAYMNRGGNRVSSAQALAQGIGPSRESTNPYFEYRGKNAVIDHVWKDGEFTGYSYSAGDDWRIPDEYRFVSDYSVREVRFLPETSSTDVDGRYVYCEEGTIAIKRELMAHRAVQVDYYADAAAPWQDTAAQYISGNWAHYTYLPLGTNQAVTIIGWNDYYSKDNFIQGSVEITTKDGKTETIDKAPPADGAWLVKNSLGSGAGDFPNKGEGTWGIPDENGVNTGYFWLSYYDRTLSGPVSYIVGEASGVDRIDQYDYMQTATNDSYLSDGEMKMANTFTAKNSQILEEVSCMTSYPDMTVTYEIYLLTGDAAQAEDGLKVAEKTVAYEYGGFHKEPLSGFDILFDTSGTGTNEILIAQGGEYSVVVTQKTKDGKYAINFPSAANTGDGADATFKGIINERESWCFKDGEWFDYAGNGDFRKGVWRELYAEQAGKEANGSIDTVNYDNFPIKGYCRKLGKDCGIRYSGSTSLQYKSDSGGSSILRLDLLAAEDALSGIAAEDVSWGVAKEDRMLVGIESAGSPAEVKITALDADEYAVTAYVRVRGVGTAPFHIYVNKGAANGIVFPYDRNTGDPVLVYEYTGVEIEPATGIVFRGQEFVKGVDYEFAYENNVKCGLASVRAEKLSDRIPDEEESLPAGTFAIVPKRAKIESVTADGDKLIVKVRDMSECGLTGYKIEYRAEGADEWKEVFLRAPGTEVILSGLRAGTDHEIRVSAYVGIEEGAAWDLDRTLYGETSVVVTATTGSAQSADPEESGAELSEAETADGRESSGRGGVIWFAAACAALVAAATVGAAVGAAAGAVSFLLPQAVRETASTTSRSSESHFFIFFISGSSS